MGAAVVAPGTATLHYVGRSVLYPSHSHCGNTPRTAHAPPEPPISVGCEQDVMRRLHEALLRVPLIVHSVLLVVEDAVGAERLHLALQFIVLQAQVLEAGHEGEALGDVA